jgi:hypothetical protein
MLKAARGILERVDPDEEKEMKEPEDIVEKVEKEFEKDVVNFSVDKWESMTPLPPPPIHWEPIIIKWKRNPKLGDSAIGVSVLSGKGWIGLAGGVPMDLRLDSGADISLVSEEFLNSLPSPPPIRKGHHMNLAQLTDKGTVIKGFTKLKILMVSMSGETIELEAEAYVVKGMSVPVLLGEDFQLNYEIGVSRNVETGTQIAFKDTPYEVEATSVEAFAGRSEVHALAANLTTLSKAVTKVKEHRRAKTRRRRRVLRNGVEGKTIHAAEDYCIRAHECKNVRVEGDFREDKEWMVERNLLANAEDSFFSVPNTLISARKPVIPVSNMSYQPHMIHRGEILGQLMDPQEYFNQPVTEEGRDRMLNCTALIVALIEARAEAEKTPESGKKERSEENQEGRRAHNKGRTRVRTDFGSGVPPAEDNAKRGVHV